MQLFGRDVGLDQPFFLIAGPCVVESEDLQLRTAEELKRVADKLGILTHRVKDDMKEFKHFIEERGTETGGWRGDVDRPAP